MSDLRPETIPDELVIHETQRPGAYLLHDLRGMVDDERRSCTTPQLRHLVLAAFLECGVTGGKRLINEKNVQVCRSSDRKAQTRRHPG